MIEYFVDDGYFHCCSKSGVLYSRKEHTPAFFTEKLLTYNEALDAYNKCKDELYYKKFLKPLQPM